ncbi:MAG TPA: glutamyl-tRNA reductase, partial [Stellaceae bacterium]|nr:glutamyl-tRNA reductase [Stellaceae bacterium]
MPGADAAGTGSPLLVVGTNHRTSAVALRDRFALVEAELAAALEGLRGAGLGEAALIATCDRVELVTTSGDGEQATARFVALLADRAGFPATAIAAGLYRHEGTAALRHVFAVTSALDALVIGEPQILGQVKAAHRLAAELGLAGASLEAIFSAAYAAARRVRR